MKGNESDGGNQMEIIQENALDNNNKVLNGKSSRLDILNYRLKMVKGEQMNDSSMNEENKRNSLRQAIDNQEIKNKFDSLDEPFDEWIIKSMPEYEAKNLTVK